MKLYLFYILLYYALLLNPIESIQTNQTDETIVSNDNKTDVKDWTNNNEKNRTKTMVLNMNIYGHNVELNFDENHKILLENSVPNESLKRITEENKPLIDSGLKLNHPDLIRVVEAPNSSRVFSRPIHKRSLIYKSLIESQYSDEMNATKYLELAVFVDYKAFQNLRTKGLIETDNEFNELILCYINQIQAIYSHKSFAQKFFINLVKIEIQRSDIFVETKGNRDELLKMFCEYQSQLNPISDSDPMHWDLALLLTGNDLYVLKDDGTRDYKSLGLGSVSGICTHKRNCVISEFEPINTLGEVWPSSGLMSTWAAAHEMAHNLGILHDGWPFNTDCPNNGFIMSSSRGTRGETNWSECSANNFRKAHTDCLNDKSIYINERYDHNKYKSRPGMVWDSDKQCKLFLRDSKAYEFPKTKARICNETILCSTPNRFGFYSSGPALEGTNCGDNSWCVNGLCQSINNINIINKNNAYIKVKFANNI